MGILACYEAWVCGRLWIRASARAIVRSVCHPAKKLVRFSLLKCPSIPNSKFGSRPHGGSVGYRPSSSPSYEASSHVKNYAYSSKLLNLTEDGSAGHHVQTIYFVGSI